MADFRTEITIDNASKPITYNSNLLFMGSCFATNMGDYFTKINSNSLVNTFGVLYNPFSIALSLERLMDDKSFTNEDMHFYNGIYHTFYHHSSFNNENAEQFLDDANKSYTRGSEFLKKTDYLFITFGTAWVYEHKESKKVVSNCHKYPASVFKRYLLSTDVIVERYNTLLSRLKRINPGINIIFTVSPVRHWKDGAHGNQISKATLLLAIEKLIENNNACSYFPAYELLIDDLRDYRFYSDDMLHPSGIAVEYIRNKLISSMFDSKAKRFIKDMEAIKKASEHRPFNITAEAHQKFIDKNITRLSQLQKEYPKVDLIGFKQAFINQKR